MKIRKSVLIPALILGPIVAGAAFVRFGVFDPAADEPHWGITYELLEAIRERGIATRTAEVTVRDGLDDPALVRAGAGNYEAMCATCHLAPGMSDGELQRGMYPSPPNLTKAEGLEAAETFWVIKHGIKMSGMPAWGLSMEDEPIWGMTAFVLQLRGMTPEQYETMVAESGGHDHGEGTAPGRVASDDHHAETEGTDPSAMPGTKTSTANETHAHKGANGPGEMAGMDHGAPTSPNGSAGVMDHGTMPGMKPSGAHPPRRAGTEGGAMAGMDHASMAGMPSNPVTGSRVVSGPAEAALQAFQDALQVGNVDLALARLAPDVVVTEDGKVDSSREAYARGHLKTDMALVKNAEVQLLNRSVNEGAEQTLIRSEARITTTGAGERVDVILDEVATLRETEDGWKIVRLEWESRPAVEQPDGPDTPLR